LKITVVGAKGVVGSAVVAYFNSLGHEVIRHDIKSGDGIETDIWKAYARVDMIFVCVPTPSKSDGSCDLSYVEKVTIAMGRVVSFENCPINVVYKSTMPPGSTASMEKILRKYSRRVVVAYNPEFLRQKCAVEDMMAPSRIVVGSPNKEFADDVMALYDATDCRKDVYNSYEAAELVKYYANCYYASRISFFNQMKMLADKFGCDHDRIVKSIVADKSVGVHGSNPTGKAYGGACLPKDVAAIIACGKQNLVDTRLLEDIQRVNRIMADANDSKVKKITEWGVSR